MPKTTRKQIGVIGVDAGLCWIGDPCYILHQKEPPDAIGRDWKAFCDKLKDRVTQFHYDLGHPGLGVCVHTGYGDGEYPVYADIDKDGTVCGVYVDFMNQFDD